jgi:hypothetical protein
MLPVGGVDQTGGHHGRRKGCNAGDSDRDPVHAPA